MSAYNGAKYIREQLDSIRLQTLPPGEVLILDDCSTDETQNVVASYLEQYELGHWRLLSNTKNLGWRESFRVGLRLVGGDYVFLADQDDIWHLSKVETMYREMACRPEMLLLASDYNLLVEGRALHARERRRRSSEGLRVARILGLRSFMRVERPGCSYCVRRELIVSALGHWVDGISHDGMLWRTALVNEGLYVMRVPLFEYRRHVNTATGPQPSQAGRMAELDTMRSAALSLSEIKGDSTTGGPFGLQDLAAFVRWLDSRIAFLTRPSLAGAISSLRASREMPYVFRSLVADGYYLLISRRHAATSSDDVHAC